MTSENETVRAVDIIYTYKRFYYDNVDVDIKKDCYRDDRIFLVLIMK